MAVNTPSLAVIVPNRNDARYLSRCLQSVLGQVRQPEELVVVDDQSTDDSVAVIEAAIAGAKNARLVRNSVNLGTNGALNAGLRHIHSEYVLFLASNDFVLPGIFAKAAECFAGAPAAGLWSAMAWLVDEGDRMIRLHPSPVVALRDAYVPPARCIALAQRHGNWFTGTTLIYRRAALEAAGGFDAAYGGLADLITALVVASRHGAAYSPAPYAAIRVHAGSFLSSTLRDAERIESILARLAQRGPQLSPGLFTPVFIERTACRFRFAAVRASGGEAAAAVGAHVRGSKGVALALLARLVPAALGRVRTALAFLVLRPFDVLPAIQDRLLGWMLVRLRARWRSPGAG